MRLNLVASVVLCLAIPLSGCGSGFRLTATAGSGAAGRAPGRSSPTTSTSTSKSNGAGSADGGDAKLLTDIAAAKVAKDGATIGRIYHDTGYPIDSDVGKAASRALFDLGDMAHLSTAFMDRDAGYGTLDQLAGDYSKDKVVAAVKDYWATATFTREQGSWSAFSIQRGFLSSAGALDASLCPALLHILRGGNIAEGPLTTAVEVRCSLDPQLVGQFLTHDDWFVRKAAATAVGKLRMRSLKPTLEALQDHDPYMDASSMTFPVRDAASGALTLLTL